MVSVLGFQLRDRSWNPRPCCGFRLHLRSPVQLGHKDPAVGGRVDGEEEDRLYEIEFSIAYYLVAFDARSEFMVVT